jgi:hypothetical protein
MNHASISPDGNLLVAVGDEGRAFFMKRIIRSTDSKYPAYDWKEIANVGLKGTVSHDCCFSTAFSSSGHICTVASQFGTITIYQTDLIREGMEDHEAVIDVIQTSRPSVSNSQSYPMPGAPRSMAFSPQPWDLLAWAEDHGRISITDLRDGFRSRQTFELDVDSKALKRIGLFENNTPPTSSRLDLENQAAFIRRHQEALDSQDPLAAVQRAAQYMEDAAERRLRRSRGPNSGYNITTGSPLTEAERELLESLRVERLRETSGEASENVRPYSINYSNRTASNSPRTTQSFSFGQYVFNRGNSRSNQSSWGPPRRRDSVIMSQSSTERSSSSHPSSLTPGLAVPLSASPSRLSSTSASENQPLQETINSNTSQSDPWATISAAMTTNQGSGSPPRNSQSTTQSSSDPVLRYQLALMEANYNQRLVEQDADELWRHRLREMGREREMASRRERLRAIQHAASGLQEDSGSLTGVEVDRLAAQRARFRQIRERAVFSSEASVDIIGADMAFLAEMDAIINAGDREPDMPSRLHGEIGVQGVGWSVDGRWL